MTRKWLRSRYIALITALILIFFTFSCGTILHPERKGQVSGRIDPGIAILNGLGLFFFLVPGVIAFAVDFSNGTIYLPEGESSDIIEKLNPETMRKIETDIQLTRKNIEKIIEKQTGTNVDLRSSSVEILPSDFNI
ncbi:MAG: hypothetical protein ACQEQS_06460 [Thermodesulfobacteriota bacterium]